MSWIDEHKYRDEGRDAARCGRGRYTCPYDTFEYGDGLVNRHDAWMEGYRAEERRREDERMEQEEAERRAYERRQQEEAEYERMMEEQRCAEQEPEL